MSVVEEFPSRANSINETPSPYREVLQERVQGDESVKHILFSPAFATGKYRSLASLFCVTDRRWIILLQQDDASVTVNEASFASTLLVELTIILLYGQLKIDFVRDDHPESAALQFNKVMGALYVTVIQDVFDAIASRSDTGVGFEENAKLVPREWPLKFRNITILYLPRGDRFLAGVYWDEIRGGFRRELAPAAALVLTDRYFICYAEEKVRAWFLFRSREPKFGEIISYFPRNRLARFTVVTHSRFNILELEGRAMQGSEKCEIRFPPDKQDEILRLLEQAIPPESA